VVSGGGHAPDAMPVVRTLAEFEARSGSRLERLIFEHRPVVMLLSLGLTLVLGALAATRHVVNADWERMMPAGHPFVATWLEHRRELRGLGNALHVVVERRRGDVWDPEYLERLRRITDELFLTPGVDRAWVRGLWMPAVRWTEVTEEGFTGGPVMPDDYDGSPRAVGDLRRNVERAGIAGTLVARDERSSAVFVPLLDRDPATGAALDYPALARRLETLRRSFEEEADGGAVAVHMVGFAVRVGELLRGLRQVAGWFAAAAAVAAALLLLHTRCLRSTALVVACSGVAVVWQVGAVSALGLALDPFSMLVPFLVFALGVSHGAQKMNGIMQDVGRGTHRLVAARYTFRRLFRAGITALATDAVGFAVLAVIDVPAVRQMAVTATLGVAMLAVTSLVLLPVLLSYAGVSPTAATRSLAAEAGSGRSAAVWRFLDGFTGRRRAAAALGVAAALAAAASLASRGTRVGDARPGAPELWPSSRYNRDDAYLAAHYDLSGDRFAVLVVTPPEGCLEHHTLLDADRLAWTLRQLPSVAATVSLPDAVRRITASTFEGNPKWLTLSRNPQVLSHAVLQATATHPDLVNPACSVVPVVAYLSDRREETLDEVVRVTEAFGRAHGDGEHRFLLGAGGAVMEAATHRVVRATRWTVALCAYGAVALLCAAALRSWRAVLVTLLPLAVTSAACQAFMAALGVGLTVATLPVIALGVGIPDFALYLLSVQLAHRRAGLSLEEAHRRALRFTGRVVVLVSFTLAAGVATWGLSPLRLQAEMGILLAFMFLGNMCAALVLVPALSRFLLDGGPRPRSAP
jgi:predicted RND superfamily exporter protein